MLHPAFPILVWCMAAHAKGYTLGRVVLTRCLAILHHLAHSPIKDSLFLVSDRLNCKAIVDPFVEAMLKEDLVMA